MATTCMVDTEKKDIGEWENFIAAQGGRMTRQRKLLFSIILNNPNLTAKEIYFLADGQGVRVSYATIYRTVRQLEKAGLLRENFAKNLKEQMK